MKVLNKTAYSTKAIRTIVVAVHREIAKHRGPLLGWKRLTVSVEKRPRSWGVSGRAWVGGTAMRLLLPTGTRVSTTSVAILCWHELLHCYGFREKDMPRSWTEANHQRWAWLTKRVGEYVPLAPVKPHAPKPPLVEVRYQRVMQAIARWEAKKHRADNALRKLRQRKVRYERRLAALKAGGPVPTGSVPGQITLLPEGRQP